MMYLYAAYGLNIESELILPELVAAGDGNDISILLSDSHDQEFVDKVDHTYLRADDEISLTIKDVATFVIRLGKEVVIHPTINVEKRTLSRYVIGPVMALLLSQRGYLVLHASCVKVVDEAIAFLGEPGMGKSSMAVAFYSLGYQVIADDVTVVHVSPGDPLVAYPAFPQIKLDPEVVSVIETTANFSDPVDKFDGKLGYRVEYAFCNSPTMLGRIFILEKEMHSEFEKISPQEAIKELLRNSYPTRWGFPGGGDHFLRCAEAVRRVPIYRIRRASSVTALKDLASNLVRFMDGQI